MTHRLQLRRPTRRDEDGVTIVSVVSSMLHRMLDARAGRPYPPALRHVLLGGGPAPLPLLEECLRRGVPVVQTYGLTETASQAATLPARGCPAQARLGRQAVVAHRAAHRARRPDRAARRSG